MRLNTGQLRGDISHASAVRPVFVADWLDATFIHFRIPANQLQPRVPLQLDLFNGDAYVSLVAFTQSNLRPVFGGRLARWISTPLAHHGFLNLRTYVRFGEQRGIYFLNEWIPNRLAVLIGPQLYGLPYHLARLNYRTKPGKTRRQVIAAKRRFMCRGNWNISTDFTPAIVGSETEFLLERYAAFTVANGILRRFLIAHSPWQQTPADVKIERSDLFPWLDPAKICSAHHSPGLADVKISAPQKLNAGYP